ncbi:FAD-dependent oxidoreductase [Aurantimonas sp. Leaf443]|uniref:dihydrolipoyl dehydrogenase family protein n=1 Tax=Aurantimonas sp. Leaf443 TaxID=1736378 RepID=UPI0006F5A554|nr:FAD-dependent oxidoreductase [Aurantimonas sp. Leaf443]KQT87900.1 dihydrolipoamide dehydrogenase [Aurantimonas sp. Leaf443]
MSDILTPDLCVVGAGAAGLSTAAGAAAFGVSTVLVERGAMGGECLNTGCVPSKALLASAHRAQAVREAGAYGIEAAPPEVDFPAVKARWRAVIAAIAPNDSRERFEGLGVTVIEGSARFVDPRTLSVDGRLVRARRFVLATGSAPAVPAIPGLAALPFLTNETLFDLDLLPEHLLVLGGGPVGVEMAQGFRRLGAAVTLVQRGPLLPRADPDLVAVLRRRLLAEGVRLIEGAEVIGAGGTPEAPVLELRGADGAAHRVGGSHLLVAAGRRASVAGLGLEAAGIAHGEKGITVGRDLRTTNPRVLAIGDATGRAAYTHAAGHQAGLAVRALLFRLPVRLPAAPYPSVTFCDPELGQAGLTQAEAEAAGHRVTVLASAFAENDRAQTEGETQGLVKLVVGRRGRLLGAGVVGAGAGELTALFCLALAKRANVGDLAGFVPAYPSLADAGKRAATAYFAPYAKARPTRALVRLLARLG